jgi:hypothetical protein
MLKKLRLRDVGPAPSFDIEFSDRLNIFTGDNGLGKSFILDIAWWTWTGVWSGFPAFPRREQGKKPRIDWLLTGHAPPARRPTISTFDFQREEWPHDRASFVTQALVVYARVDGGFSVWDPARNFWQDGTRNFLQNGRTDPEWGPRAFQFSVKTLWDGLEEHGETLCNGLIRDWVAWQNQPKSSPFEVLGEVVTRLSPPDEEPIKIGLPVRLSAVNVKDYPTLAMPYGEVPLVHASAGMKRIASLAYMVTWAWDEHKRASRLRNQEPVEHVVLLIDEVESHLHPRWQRTLLPSILDVGKALKADVDLQILTTTHAPLVLASIEPHFDEDRDSLFLFERQEKTKYIALRKLPWAKQGDADNWLTSEIFDLKQARSREAEEAIEAAKAFIREDRASLPPGLNTRDQIDRRLHELLGGQDPFLIRWSISTEAHGR